MARKRIEARTARVDGRPVVVVSPDDFELLETYRRQVGAGQAQVSRMSRELRATRERLAEAAETARPAADQIAAQPCTCTDAARCGRCEAVDALIPLAESSGAPGQAPIARSA